MDSIAETIIPPQYRFAAAYRRLIIRHGRDEHRRKAIQRGYDLMDTRGWEWDGNILTIDSSELPKRYRVTTYGCECLAASRNLNCKHMAFRSLCVEATKPLTSSVRIRADIQAAVDELV